MSNDKPPANPATSKQKWIVAALLLVSTSVFCGLWFYVLNQLEKEVGTEYKVAWTEPAGSVLKSGPPEFRYDMQSNYICYRGIVDTENKSKLTSLIGVGNETNSASSDQSFQRAVDDLAYESNARGGWIMFLLLVLGGLSSVLGVQLRSVVNFINVVCYTEKLDVMVWWPWYLMRPFAGFLIGLIVVLLVKAEVLFKGEAAADGSLWWAAVALLAGFGASEFTDRLRLLSQTMFGEEKK